MQVFIKYLETRTIWINDVLFIIFRDMAIDIFNFTYLFELKYLLSSESSWKNKEKEKRQMGNW